MEFSIPSLRKRSAKSRCPTGKLFVSSAALSSPLFLSLAFSLDLDAWINDPPSESEDESTAKNGRYDANYDRNLFSGDQSESYYHGSQLDSHGLETSSYNKPKNYTEPSAEELAERRESRKRREQSDPYYLPDKPKSKALANVSERRLDSIRFGIASCPFRPNPSQRTMRLQHQRRHRHEERFPPVYSCRCPISCIVRRRLTRRIVG